MRIACTVIFLAVVTGCATPPSASSKATTVAQPTHTESSSGSVPDDGSIPGNGVYKVGSDVKPGEYKTSGKSDCSYSILKTSNTSKGVEDFNQTDGQARVTLVAGKYFETQDCAPWEPAD